MYSKTPNPQVPKSIGEIQIQPINVIKILEQIAIIRSSLFMTKSEIKRTRPMNGLVAYKKKYTREIHSKIIKLRRYTYRQISSMIDPAFVKSLSLSIGLLDIATYHG
jgi:hypothetical protein